jgi:hypothetical protein
VSIGQTRNDSENRRFPFKIQIGSFKSRRLIFYHFKRVYGVLLFSDTINDTRKCVQSTLNMSADFGNMWLNATCFRSMFIMRRGFLGKHFQGFSNT